MYEWPVIQPTSATHAKTSSSRRSKLYLRGRANLEETKTVFDRFCGVVVLSKDVERQWV